MLGDKKLMAFVVISGVDKVRDFYQNTLGLKLIEEHEFAIVFDAFGIELRLQKASEHTPLQQTALGWAVPDIRATVAKLIEHGVELVRYEGMGQDELGIWQPQEGVQICWFRDPDGNLLSLTQS